MSVSYYPWNTAALADWLQTELSGELRLRDLAQRLHIPPHMISRWTRDRDPYLTLEHVEGIAHYRGWTLEKTAAWLEINEGHWQTLKEEASRYLIGKEGRYPVGQLP